MDFITSAILGGFVYDLLKQPVISLTTELVRQQLSGWSLGDTVPERLVEHIQHVPKHDRVSKEAVTAFIESSPDWQALIKEIKPTVAVNNNYGVTAGEISGGFVTGTHKTAGDTVQVAGNYYAATPEEKPPKKS